MISFHLPSPFFSFLFLSFLFLSSPCLPFPTFLFLFPFTYTSLFSSPFPSFPYHPFPLHSLYNYLLSFLLPVLFIIGNHADIYHEIAYLEMAAVQSYVPSVHLQEGGQHMSEMKKYGLENRKWKVESGQEKECST